METKKIGFETEVRTFDEVPVWIDQDITVADVVAIAEGGCASGAYMPAVTYHEARKTMHEHGDEVLEYLDDLDLDGEIYRLPEPGSPLAGGYSFTWGGIAVHFLSCAVEWWACDIFHKLCELDGIE